MSKCKACGQRLVHGLCRNKSCRSYSIEADQAKSIDPDSMPGGTLSAGAFPEDPSTDGDVVRSFPSQQSVPSGSTTGSAGEEYYSEPRSLDDDLTELLEEGEEERLIAEFEGSDEDDPSSERRPIYTQRVELEPEDPAQFRDEFIVPIRNIAIPKSTSAAGSKSGAAGSVDAASPGADGEDFSLPINPELKVLGELGRGGMSVVWEVEQVALKRKIAMKVLLDSPRPENPGTPGTPRSPEQQTSSRNSVQDRERRKRRFLREALLTAKLQHPNIVPAHDFCMTPDGTYFLLIRKIEGIAAKDGAGEQREVFKRSSWAEFIGELPLERNLEIFRDVCNAINYSHRQGVIHRDLKPGNVMLGEFGEVYVIDWGLAAELGKPEMSPGGTPEYMSPESVRHHLAADKVKTFRRLLALEQQNRGTRIGDFESAIKKARDERESAERSLGVTSDVYLLGAILYQIVRGKPPHSVAPRAGESSSARSKRVLLRAKTGRLKPNPFAGKKDLKSVTRAALYEIACQAMNVNPEERYQSVEELLAALANYDDLMTSRSLAERGREDLDKARGRDDYEYLLPALEALRAAAEKDPRGELLTDQTAAACLYAKRTLKKGEFDAGLYVLDKYASAPDQANLPEVVETRQTLVRGKARRRLQRNILLAGWLLAIVGLPTVIWIGNEVNKNLIAEQKEQIATLDEQMKKQKEDQVNLEKDKFNLEKDNTQLTRTVNASKHEIELDKKRREVDGAKEEYTRFKELQQQFALQQQLEQFEIEPDDTPKQEELPTELNNLLKNRKETREILQQLLSKSVRADFADAIERAENQLERLKLDPETENELISQRTQELKKLDLTSLKEFEEKAKEASEMWNQITKIKNEILEEKNVLAKSALDNATKESVQAQGALASERLKLAEVRFDKVLVEFESRLNAIANNLRTNQLQKAKDLLSSAKTRESTGEQLTGPGWEERHLQLQVGPLTSLPENSAVHWVQRREGSDLAQSEWLDAARGVEFVIGVAGQDGGAASRELFQQMYTAEGQPAERRSLAKLPLGARLEGLHVVGGRWLVAAYDYASNQETAGPKQDRPPWALLDLATGKEARLGETLRNERRVRVSCRLARLKVTGENGLELYTVEEEAFDRSTSDRLRARRYRLSWRAGEDGSVELALQNPGLVDELKLSGATSDERPVDYKAAFFSRGDACLIAVAAESDDKFYLQLANWGLEGWRSDPVRLPGRPLGLSLVAAAPPGVRLLLALENTESTSSPPTSSPPKVWQKELLVGGDDLRPAQPSQTSDELQELGLAWETSTRFQNLLAAPRPGSGFDLITVHAGGELFVYPVSGGLAPASGDKLKPQALRGHTAEIAWLGETESPEAVLLTGDTNGRFGAWPLTRVFARADIALTADQEISAVAIDRKTSGGEAGIAYGLGDGRIEYFSGTTLAMDGGKITLKSPFRELGRAFTELSSMAKVGNELVLLDRRGELSVWALLPNGEGVAREPRQRKRLSSRANRGFRPLLVAQAAEADDDSAAPDTIGESSRRVNYFLTNDPEVKSDLHLWLRDPDTDAYRDLRIEPAWLDNRAANPLGPEQEIEALAISPTDPKQIAIALRGTGGYVSVVIVDLQDVSDPQPEVIRRTDSFYVDDPVFLQYSADGSELGYHYFEPGTVQTLFARTPVQPVEGAGSIRLINKLQEVSLRSWYGDQSDNSVVVGRNRKIQVINFTNEEAEGKKQGRFPRNAGAQLFAAGLKMVVLERQTEQGQAERGQTEQGQTEQGRKMLLCLWERGSIDDEFSKTPLALNFDRATALRWLGGEEFLVLDQKGIHWVSFAGQTAKPKMWLERDVACAGLELSGELLVANYSNDETRLFRLPSDSALELRDENSKPLRFLTKPSLSPDGRSLTAVQGDKRFFWHKLDQSSGSDPSALGRLETPLEVSSVGCWVANSHFVDGGKGYGWLSVATGPGLGLTWKLTQMTGEGLLSEEVGENRLPATLPEVEQQFELVGLHVAPLTNDYFAVHYRLAGKKGGSLALLGRRFLTRAESASPRWKWETVASDELPRDSVDSVSFGELRGRDQKTAVRLLVGQRENNTNELRAKLFFPTVNWEVNKDLEERVFRLDPLYEGLIPYRAKFEPNGEPNGLEFSGNGRSILLRAVGRGQREVRILQSSELPAAEENGR